MGMPPRREGLPYIYLPNERVACRASVTSVGRAAGRAQGRAGPGWAGPEFMFILHCRAAGPCWEGRWAEGGHRVSHKGRDKQ